MCKEKKRRRRRRGGGGKVWHANDDYNANDNNSKINNGAPSVLWIVVGLEKLLLLLSNCCLCLCVLLRPLAISGDVQVCWPTKSHSRWSLKVKAKVKIKQQVERKEAKSKCAFELEFEFERKREREKKGDNFISFCICFIFVFVCKF